MNDHRAVYTHIRLTLCCYLLWRLETELGPGATADAVFADREIQDQISTDAQQLTIAALGPVVPPVQAPPTLEQDIVRELAETMARTEDSPRAEDRPVLASQVVSEFQARRSRELLALSVRARRLRAG